MLFFLSPAAERDTDETISKYLLNEQMSEKSKKWNKDRSGY